MKRPPHNLWNVIAKPSNLQHTLQSIFLSFLPIPPFSYFTHKMLYGYFATSPSREVVFRATNWGERKNITRIQGEEVAKRTTHDPTSDTNSHWESFSFRPERNSPPSCFFSCKVYNFLVNLFHNQGNFLKLYTTKTFIALSLPVIRSAELTVAQFFFHSVCFIVKKSPEIV